MKLRPILLTVCLLASLGCDIDGFTGLDTEMLTVSVTTVGANFDPDGYMLSITGEHDEPIGVNESKSFNVLTMNLTVELSGVATNCAAHTNPIRVDVNGPTSVGFFVECV